MLFIAQILFGENLELLDFQRATWGKYLIEAKKEKLKPNELISNENIHNKVNIIFNLCFDKGSKGLDFSFNF